MLKKIKSLAEKIKFKFRGLDNTTFVFDSNIKIPVDKEVTIKQVSSREDHTNVREIKKCNKNTRYLVLRAAYGDDKLPLIKILNRTKKFRIRKKLIKRITK